jgi:limonene-1,2-epoxide hydrolase
MLKAWDKLDLDAVMDYFDDKARYENVPLDPLVGRDAIRVVIGGILSVFASVDVNILHQLSDGGTVMNERIDTITSAINGGKVPLRVMGIFEISNGKIVGWRDYFDSTALSAVFDPPASPASPAPPAPPA